MLQKENLWNKLKEFKYAEEMVAKIKGSAGQGLKLMEVCGTHTMNVSRFGLRKIFQGSLELVSGPGCPVCVTDLSEIDIALELCRQDKVTVATFGDMVKVPGSHSTLWEEKSRGRDVRVVYSPYDALEIARREKEREVVFLAVGFETTIPVILLTLEKAHQEKIRNFSILVLHKATPPAVKGLLQDENTAIDGFILPGHVSSIIGRKSWDFISRDYSLPAVVTGFDVMDILSGIHKLCLMAKEGKPMVLNDYKRGVLENGNPKALALIEKYLEPFPAMWRGIGEIPDSGLYLKKDYQEYDALKRFDLTLPETVYPKGCICGEILKGRKKPFDCPLFSTACSPIRAIGPCMVSSEGACAAYYQYEREVPA